MAVANPTAVATAAVDDVTRTLSRATDGDHITLQWVTRRSRRVTAVCRVATTTADGTYCRFEETTRRSAFPVEVTRDGGRMRIVSVGETQHTPLGWVTDATIADPEADETVYIAGARRGRWHARRDCGGMQRTGMPAAPVLREHRAPCSVCTGEPREDTSGGGYGDDGELEFWCGQGRDDFDGCGARCTAHPNRHTSYGHKGDCDRRRAIPPAIQNGGGR